MNNIITVRHPQTYWVVAISGNLTMNCECFNRHHALSTLRDFIADGVDWDSIEIYAGATEWIETIDRSVRQ